MGICHICKEQTSLYCVNHEKHICLKCLVTNHKECCICQYIDYVDNKVTKDNTCTICDEELYEGENILRLPCLHMFHVSCLRSYFSDSNSFTCPHCNSPILHEDYITNPLLPLFIKEFITNQTVKEFNDKHAIIEYLENAETIEDVENKTVSLHSENFEEVYQSEPNQQEYTEIELDMEEDKKTTMQKAVVANSQSLLKVKKNLTMRSRILIGVVIIAFVVMVYLLQHQHQKRSE
ncbi:putative Ring finger protein [Entamoeba marina]